MVKLHLFFRICPTAVMRVRASKALLSEADVLLSASWLWAVAVSGLPFAVALLVLCIYWGKPTAEGDKSFF